MFSSAKSSLSKCSTLAAVIYYEVFYLLDVFQVCEPSVRILQHDILSLRRHQSFCTMLRQEILQEKHLNNNKAW